MEDLIFVSIENWDDVWRRNQQICAELARRHPETKILFVGLSRDVSNDIRNGHINSLRIPAARQVPNFPNITFTRPLKLAPDTLRLGRRFNEKLIRHHVRSMARKLGMRRPVLWLNPHYAVHMVGKMGEACTIYDITDDWISLTQRPHIVKLVTAQDAELCRIADGVIVCSSRLLEMKREMTKHLYLVANGVDPAHYRTILDDPTGPRPAEASQWRRPVLGYTGSIHRDRVDIGLVREIALRMPHASVVLVGPQFLSRKKDDFVPLQSLPNVYMTGPVPYTQIPNYMRPFDVSIVPHRMSEFTESLNPIKLWEYLAAGKPIVSTDVAGFRDYPQFVRIAHNAEEFVRGVEAALGESPDVGALRRAESEKHSWASRVDQIEEIMAACLARVETGGSSRSPQRSIGK